MEVGEQLGINPERLPNWVKQAEIDAGERPGTSTDDAVRIAELEREVNQPLTNPGLVMSSLCRIRLCRVKGAGH